jgi:carbon-monoxide dehydrogenase iron sulfur subunit
MNNLLLVDMAKCTSCKQCALACSLTKEELFDPLRGRIKILKQEDIALGVQLLCEQCDAHPCVDACPDGALTRQEETGIITVDASLCNDCESCADSCIYHGIRIHPVTKTALICDLCGGDPYCVPHCVPGALTWVEKTEDNLKLKKKLRSARMAMYRDVKKGVAI